MANNRPPGPAGLRGPRVACPFANSQHHNEEHGCAGGKGDEFPLLDPTRKATGVRSTRYEEPVILDPCSEEDCALVAFQADGRPVLDPRYANDPVARRRLEESKLLLNLDHPDFNAQRERLLHEINEDVLTHEDLPVTSPQREAIKARTSRRILPNGTL